ncbi:MAG: hypothetical protein KIT33_11290 [Candidatus Kapabacteria bacterium]|nr:hypothetical protein [Ignavibacteriota bacterium]MCW5885542.1 hypothetical protein [Candidatus Kapabacteria bacterium]
MSFEVLIIDEFFSRIFILMAPNDTFVKSLICISILKREFQDILLIGETNLQGIK